MNSYLKKFIGILLAVTLVVGLGFYASDARLKASDEEVLPEVEAAPAPDPEPAPEPAPEPEPVEVVVEENEDYVLSEVLPANEEAPAEEAPAEEVTAEENPAEEAPAEEIIAEEEPAEEVPEEEAFDVVAAYEYYITLSDADKEAFLNSLSAENRAALLNYIRQMEQAAEVPVEEAPEEETEKIVDVWYEYDGEPHLGMQMKVVSSISGFSGNVTYQWQRSADKGATWEDVAGATDSSYTYWLDEDTCIYSWRLNVNEAE